MQQSVGIPNSDPRLIGTYDRRARLLGSFGSTVVLTYAYVACVAVAAYVRPSTWLVTTAVLLTIAATAMLMLALRSHIEFRTDGIRVVNGLRGTDLSWAQVDRFIVVDSRASRMTRAWWAFQQLLRLPTTVLFFLHGYHPKLRFVAVRTLDGSRELTCVGLSALQLIEGVGPNWVPIRRKTELLNVACQVARANGGTLPSAMLRGGDQSRESASASSA